jgi:hypothetical protein
MKDATATERQRRARERRKAGIAAAPKPAAREWAVLELSDSTGVRFVMVAPADDAKPWASLAGRQSAAGRWIDSLLARRAAPSVKATPSGVGYRETMKLAAARRAFHANLGRKLLSHVVGGSYRPSRAVTRVAPDGTTSDYGSLTVAAKYNGTNHRALSRLIASGGLDARGYRWSLSADVVTLSADDVTTGLDYQI